MAEATQGLAQEEASIKQRTALVIALTLSNLFFSLTSFQISFRGTVSKQAEHTENITELASRADLADEERAMTDQVAAALAATVDLFDTSTAQRLAVLDDTIGTVSQAVTDNKLSLGDVIADVASHEVRIDSLSTASNNAQVSLAALAFNKASHDDVSVGMLLDRKNYVGGTTMRVV